MSKSIHDEIAERIAKKLGTDYKAHEGIDIVKDKVIEVETKKSSLSQGLKQVIRSQKPRYLAVNEANIENALEVTEGTGVGVMGPTGRIIKRASRKG
jgi:glutathione synthase/RimK-type ligase-like ATP-grasp enzyme